jgi:DNA-binding PucR family transcriptional regulator
VVPEQVLGRLRAALPEVADEVVDRVWERLPGYEATRMRRSDLERVVLPNLAAVLAALGDGRRPTEGELRRATLLGEGRALQGVPIDGLLQSWRTAERVLLDRLLLAGAALGTADLREATRHLGDVFDDLAGASLGAYRRTQEEVTVHFDRLTTDLVARLAAERHADPEEIAAHATRIEVDPDRPYRAAALGLPPTAAPVAVARLRRHVLGELGVRVAGRILAGTHRDHVLLLVPVSGDDDLVGALSRALARPELEAAATCGLGEPQPRLAEVGVSCAQAEDALQVGLRRGLGRAVVAYVDVLPQVLLVHNRDVAHRLVTTRLGPLLERPDLVTTLRVFLASGQSVRASAAALDVHPNTVAYRLSRIRQRTGRSLTDAVAATDLLLALSALDLYGPLPWDP